MSRNMLVYGAEEAPEEPIELWAGPVRLLFEPERGWIRKLTVGNEEIVRAVYATVRDEQWGTIDPVITGVNLERRADSFRASFTARHRLGDIDFQWSGTVQGNADGVITFSFDGEALSTFGTNRTGICMLHPAPALTGVPCEIVHTDRTSEIVTLSPSISPHQPFFDIRGLHHETAGGTRVQIGFEGETFETEDQRNWGDASYKTYCRPLAAPKPYRLQRGTRVRQSVRIEFLAASDGKASVPVVTALTRSSEAPAPLPPLGTLVTGRMIGANQLGRFEALQLRAVQKREDGAGSAAYSAHSMTIDGAKHILISPPEAAHRSPELRTALGQAAVFCAASRENFTELNRCRPGSDEVDGVAFVMNAQAHSFDTRSILESVGTAADCVATAKEFTMGPIHVGPLYLNAKRSDPRDQSLISAVWMVASIRALVHSDAASIVYFDDVTLVGEDRVSPAYHVLLDLAEAGAASPSFQVVCSTERVAAFACESSVGHVEYWISNLTSVRQSVEVPEISGEISVRRLNSDTVEDAVYRPEQFRRLRFENTVRGSFRHVLGPYETVHVVCLR